MAIYHLSVKPISRSAGRTATAAAAYRAGAKIIDERTGEIHDYTRKGGVVSADIVLPDGAPAWALDRAKLWNAAELAEKRKDACVAREFEVALPSELPPAERQRLALDFAKEMANREGCAVDVAIHAPGKEGDNRNHHAHILRTTRKVEADGLGAKLDTEKAGRKRTDDLDSVRTRWADLTNERLRENGIAARVDHRSFEAQGITDRAPGVHLGPAATAIVRRGEQSTIAARARAAADEFLARAAVDAAHAAAAVAAVADLERELAQAQQDAARSTRSRDELVRELEPLHAQLRKAQVIIDAGAKSRPTALPEVKVSAAKKELPGLQAKSDKATQRARKIDAELGQLGWWRPVKKAQLRRDLELAKRDAAALAKRLAGCKATANAAVVEIIDRVVAEQKALQAELAPQCWALEKRLRELEKMEFEMTQAQTDQELAELAKARMEQTGAPPRADELAAIDRILIEQARQRLATDRVPRERERQR